MSSGACMTKAQTCAIRVQIDVKNFRLKRPGYKISWQIWIDNHTINVRSPSLCF